MGFETQEQAERFAEEAEFRADQLREELLLNPKEAVWRRVVQLPSHKDMSPATVGLMRAVFDLAWEAGSKAR